MSTVIMVKAHIKTMLSDFSVLCKPLRIDCTQKTSAALQTLDADITLGLAEIVEVVFDMRGATASFMGFHLPIENILPEYCEVSKPLH